MIADKFNKNSIKKFQVLGKKDLQQVETSAHNKILNLQISGFREKVTANENSSTGKYKNTTKIANIKISTIKFQVKQD